MEDKVIFFDINMKKWTPIKDNTISGANLEYMPVAIFIEEDGLRLLWDSQSKEWKVVAWCEGIEAYTTDGKYVRGMPVILNMDSLESNQLIPISWTVKYLVEREAVFVGVEFIKMRIKENRTLPKIENIYSNNYGNCTFNMRTGRHYVYRDYQAPPLEVVKEAAKMMQMVIKNMYGRKPVLTEDDLHQEEFLEAFCFQPFDPQCYPLKKWIGFWNEIPRDSSSVYDCICGCWQITPPPKLKEIYKDYPQALPMYRILQELGFKDFSIMEKFFAIGKIGSLGMNEFTSRPVLRVGEYIETDTVTKREADNYDGDGCIISQAEIDALIAEKAENNDVFADEITQDEIDMLLDGGEIDDVNRDIYYPIYYKKWNWLKMIVSWMIEKRSEEIAAKNLIDYSMNKSSIWLNDLTHIVRNNFEDLPSDILEMILDKGYTREVYDIIVKQYVVRKYVCL